MSAEEHACLLRAAGVMAITLAAVTVYLPALRGQFILDDDVSVTHNSLVQASDGYHGSGLASKP